MEEHRIVIPPSITLLFSVVLVLDFPFNHASNLQSHPATHTLPSLTYRAHSTNHQTKLRQGLVLLLFRRQRSAPLQRPVHHRNQQSLRARSHAITSRHRAELHTPIQTPREPSFQSRRRHTSQPHPLPMQYHIY